MANEPTKRRFTTFESLAVRDYRLLWLGQVSTSMGQWMDQITRGWLIYQLTGSPFQLGLATAMRGFPLLIFGIAAGALADRSGRKAQLIIAQVVNAILNIVLAALVVTGLVEPWHVYVTAFMAGTVQAFQQPARQTLISDIVGNERLLNALALNSAALNGSRVLGPSIAGLLIVRLGVANSYFLQGAMYLVATIWTFQMQVPEPHTDRIQRQREPFLKSITEGFAFVAREANIRTLIMLALGPLTFAMAYTSMMPLIAIEVLHGDASTQGLLLSFIGVGALGGALVVASLKRSAGYGLPVVIGALLFSGAVFAFASSSVLWVSCILGVVLGAFSVTYTTQNQTLLQVLAPRRIRGRVMSIYLLNRATVPMGALLAGALASSFGGQTAIHVMSGIAIAIVVLVVTTHPEFIRLRVGFSDAEEADRERVAASEDARRGTGVTEAGGATERV
ncbi:MAG: MFS transporter [Chloroflexi bacterium]|nr:MAG: MFS transporter [Chloroflexota bacterium]